jgi:hypothetical protein
MEAKAIYTQEVFDDTGDSDNPRVVHGIDHNGGGFSLSSEVVGVAVQNFLNNATSSDMRQLHSHLLYAYKEAWDEESKLPEEDEHGE